MKDIWYGTSGIRNADIVIVGEAWGHSELTAERPFVGGSGAELTRMLAEGGIQRPLCFITNVIAARPDNNEMWRFFHPTKGAPGPALRGLFPTDRILDGLTALREQIAAIHPKLVIACGNYALWALTNCTAPSSPADTQGRRVPSGIDSWRGSMWYCDALPAPLNTIPCLPIYHPAAIMRSWHLRAVTIHDLSTRSQQALCNDWRPSVPPTVLAPPSFEEARTFLQRILTLAAETPTRVVCDIETARGLITCVGFASSERRAISIPLVQVTNDAFSPYWPITEDHELFTLIRKVLLHPNILIEGQNFLYDTQYFQRFFGCTPRLDFDTMLAHHLLFPGTPKGLDYLSSLYCKYHWYWKDDGKEWNTRGGLPTLLSYNAMDCLRTYEVATVLRSLIPSLNQTTQWEREKEKNLLALKMMNRGIRIDTQRRAQLALDLMTAASEYEAWFTSILPQEWVTPDTKDPTPWYRSSKQQRDFFSEELGLSLPKHKKTGNITFGKEALTTLRTKHPEFVRLFDALRDYRSIEVFHKTFIKAPLDTDQRMRCSFNTAGTETFRWSSSENAFGSGTNLQNIPKGNEKE